MDRDLAFRADWTVLVRGSSYRRKEEARTRAEDPNIPPAPRSADEIREERVKQMAAFEDMERLIWRG